VKVARRAALAGPDAEPHIQALAGSFRDPSGFVFECDGVLYRQVNAVYRNSYDHLMASGLYQALTASGLLIPHSEAALASHVDARAYKTLRPERIRFISYPYEWCFSQLKDAALATLAIQQKALAFGMSLKDSSAFNIQFRGCQPVLIDTLSFEPYQEGRPWIAYRQFCQHFLAPLALMSAIDVRLGQLLRTYIDGVPLDLASRMLPARTHLSFRLLVHIHLHARAMHRFAGSRVTQGDGRVSRSALCGLLDNLRASVEALTWRPQSTAWSDYERETNYSTEARDRKEEIVHALLQEIRAGSVWDLGANAGRFSRMAAAMNAYAVAFDADHSSTELHYRACRAAGETGVLPLVTDLTNPSPALGWAHNERLSWAERGPADAILALAIVHHLAIGNNVPLARIAEFLQAAGTHLIIEFVPKTDSQVQRLLATREDVFSEYSQEGFERAFEQRFQILRSIPVRDSHRIIYLMRRRQFTV
jgi:hypothetical protein